MRHSTLLVMAAAILGSTVSFAQVHIVGKGEARSNQQTILIGERGAPERVIARAAAGLGKVGKKDAEGFYHMTLSKSVTLKAAIKKLKARGMDYVFEAEATKVDNSSLLSVERHISYLKARHNLRAKMTVQTSAKEEESGVDFYEALEHYLRVRVGPDGKLDKDEMDSAIKQREAMTPGSTGGGGPNAPYTVWSYQGPNNVPVPYSQYYGIGPLSGRKNDIAVFPGNSNIIYTASAGGGIWKTLDGGVTWTPLSDKWAYLHTSAVAVHPSNSDIVLAGTGDYNGFFGKQTQGIMRSTNGGITWTQVGDAAMKTAVVTKIIFNPANPNQVVCATGKTSIPGYPGFIYTSSDAGATWAQRLTGVDFDDMELGPTGTLWFAAVAAAHNNGGFVWKSLDFGDTWIPATVPVAVNQAALDIATSKLDGNTVYLLSTGDNKIYKSTNGAGTWTDVTGNFPTGTSNYNWSQKTYDQWLGCTSNGGQDVLLCGLITVAQSVGGNGVWTDIARAYEPAGPNNLHNDSHCYAVDPNNPSTVYIGCDGGIFRYTYSASPGPGNFASLNATIGDLQHYQLAMHPTDLSYLITGTQDNASPSARGNLANWTNLYAGDGAWGDFDQTTPGIHFSGSQLGSVWRYTTAGDTSPDFISPAGFSGGFIAPAVFAGTGGSEIYLAGVNLLRWVSGTTWTTVMAGLGGVATTIAKSPNNTNVLYTGTSSGAIWRTLDNGGSFKDLSNVNLDRPIGDIGVSYTSDTDVVVGMQGTGPNHVWRCFDTSATIPVWKNVSGNLPTTPVNAVCFDPYNANRWYVGTDIGVFMTGDGGNSYTNVGYLGLPNVHVNALRVSKNKAYIYAATFGRGIWRLATTSNPFAFSITGTVRTVSNALFSGVSLSLRRYEEYQKSYSNTTPLAIPDNNSTGVTSSLPITLNYPMSGCKLYLNITHPYRGDLEVTVIAPDGQEYRVQNPSNDPGDNIKGYYELDKFATGLQASGTWQLRVRDLVQGDVGQIIQWNIIPRIYTYVTKANTTSDGSGNYSFTGLSAGKYLVTPSFTGKTWTPPYRPITVGPSRTLQNFQANQ